MKGFELQLWHLMVLISPLVIGIFKQEIKDALYAYAIIRSRKYKQNQKIQIMSTSGVWEDAIVVDYHYSIPFRKIRAGIVLKGIDATGNEYQEKISFSIWKTLRTRSQILAK